MSSKLAQLALLEGTPANVEEAQARFGIQFRSFVPSLVALVYHRAKADCLSGDPIRVAQGQAQMLLLANACKGLAEFYFAQNLHLEAAQAAEVEGTAAGFAGDPERERLIALTWCERLTGSGDWQLMVLTFGDLAGDLAVIFGKFLFKLAKFKTELSFDERWALVEIAAQQQHPDALGRALWACELIADEAKAYDALLGLRREDLLAAAKQDQRERFLTRLGELEAGA